MTTALEKALSMNLPPLVRESLTDPDWMVKVLAFHHFYNVPIMPFGRDDEQFNHMTNARVALRLGFQVEELKEAFIDGFGIDVEIYYKIPDKRAPGNTFRVDSIEDALSLAEDNGLRRNGQEVADAAGDSIYFWLGFLIEMGYDLRPVFEEVHASNMTKPDEDGKPIYREDGKVLKGPNYMKPNIRAALGFED